MARVNLYGAKRGLGGETGKLVGMIKVQQRVMYEIIVQFVPKGKFMFLMEWIIKFLKLECMRCLPLIC